MAQPKEPGALLPFTPAGIPEALKVAQRWAPWKAVWNPKRGKWDKIPCHPASPFYGISTNRAHQWCRFDVAMAAALANPAQFAGAGYLMTGTHGIVGIDLDNCVADGVVAEWALQIAKDLGSYTEFSPSGNGLRVIVKGSIPDDWTNHERGIEVYAGHEARFLTITGLRLPTWPDDVREAPSGALEALSKLHAKEHTPSNVLQMPAKMPEVLDELALPDIETLELPWQAREFLADGTHSGDRSRALHATAVALYGAGLDEQTVFSTLATNTHAFEVALDHRRQDSDRALTYLWVEHAHKAKGKATSRVANLDDFDDVSGTPSPTTVLPVGAPAHSAPANKAKRRFNIQQAAEFSQGAPVRWAIKKLIPYAELGVVYGESGAGKSFFTLDLVFSLATGRQWRDRKVNGGGVLYICAEGAGGFRARMKAYASYFGVELDSMPLYVLGDVPNMLEKKDLEDLIAAARALGVKFDTIVLDTLAQVTPGANENSGEDMGRALGHCKVLGKALKAMTLLVAHSGKDATRGVRGWSGIKGALDVEILVEKSGTQHLATVTKMKDGQGEGDEHAFELVSVVLGKDEDGEDITSCVVKPTVAVPKAQRKAEPKGANEKLVMRLAVDLTDLPGVVTTTQLIDAVVNEMPKPEGKRDQRRTVVMRAIESLVASNRLSVAGGQVNVQ